MFDWNKVELFNHSACTVPEIGEILYDDGCTNFELDSDLEGQIEYAAKVSNPSAQKNFEEREPGRLTKYLINNNHWSPLEMVSVGLKIETTRDIGRQILRHRSFHFQEFSQRYAEVETDNYVLKQARSQDMKNRQNSNDDMDDHDKKWFDNTQRFVYQHAMEQYQQALKRGVAKEVARSMLPEGMTPTVMFMSGTVRDWYHYCALRTANGTQLEHMDVAIKCNNVLHNLMPNLFEAMVSTDGLGRTY